MRQCALLDSRPDAAIALGIEHGGWCPRGRKAEDGTIPERYTLTGGSALTIQHAHEIGKPVLHVDLGARDGESAATLVRRWLIESGITVLNVAGSRESKAPGLAEEVCRVLVRALRPA